MTCTIGFVDEMRGKIYLGSDSIAVVPETGEYLLASIGEKVFNVCNEKDNFIFGMTGSFRTAQILKHNFIPPIYDENKYITSDPITEYMQTDFIEAFSQLIISALDKDSNLDERWDSAIMVAFQNRLFVVNPGFSVIAYYDSFRAIGAGSSVALGALEAISDNVSEKYTAKQMLDDVFKIVAKHNVFVKPPFVILEMDYLKSKE